MPGLQSLNAQVQPITGNASIDAALAALSPQDQAKLAAGIDPLADGSAIPSVDGGVPGMVPNNPPLTPEARAAIGAQLQQILQSLPPASSEADAALGSSLENAIGALMMGAQ